MKSRGLFSLAQELQNLEAYAIDQFHMKNYYVSQLKRCRQANDKNGSVLVALDEIFSLFQIFMMKLLIFGKNLSRRNSEMSVLPWTDMFQVLATY